MRKMFKEEWLRAILLFGDSDTLDLLKNSQNVHQFEVGDEDFCVYFLCKYLLNYLMGPKIIPDPLTVYTCAPPLRTFAMVSEGFFSHPIESATACDKLERVRIT